MSRKLVNSFKFASEGVAEVFKTQRNFRIQVAAGVIAVGMAIFFNLSNIEWAVLILTIALVLSSEMVNTAIEATVDLNTVEIHPKAKLAKDLSAGVVLINALVAFLVAIFIFIPHLLEKLKI